jgi:hypothetical protein
MNRTFRLNTAHFPKELTLLLELLQEHDDTDISEKLKDKLSDMDWDRFLELVRHHRVYPLIYVKLKNVDKELIPEQVLQNLHSDYIRNTFQMLHLSGEMERICKILNENGIRTLMLKGPVLAEALYGDISLRTSRDLDILIHVADIEKSEEILKNCGYKLKDEFPRILGDWKWRTHHINYFHPQKKIEIELHWRLKLGIGNEPDFKELWERKVRSSLTSEPIYFLGEEDLFLFLTSHGARHAWSRLRWLVDIDRLVRKGLRWEIICFLLKKHQNLHIAGQSLLLASELLQTPLTQSKKFLTFNRHAFQIARQSIFFIKEKADLFPTPPKYLAGRLNRYFISLMPLSQKYKYYISILHPTSYDAEMLPLPKSLHFIYFPLRPFLWFWRQMKHRTHA